MLPQFWKSTFLEVHILYKDKTEQELINEIVDRIDMLRVESGYSIYELANKSDTSINTIKHLYKKKSLPTVRTIFGICEAFNMPVWMFFYDEDKKFTISKKVFSLIENYENLSENSKRLLMELSENLK